MQIQRLALEASVAVQRPFPPPIPQWPSHYEFDTLQIAEKAELKEP